MSAERAAANAAGIARHASGGQGAHLRVRGLSAGYGIVPVLHGIDLDVPAAELTVIVGPNGAGKTTLLKALSGLLPYSGTVELDGVALAARAAVAVRRGLIHVPEGRQLFAQMTVRENLELGGWNAPRAERARKLHDVLTQFPRLAERQSQLAGTLSGGEQQMLAIGRALMGSPRLLMLDEPSLGLAPKVVAELFEVVQRIRMAGTGVLLVEQNVALALRAAQSAYVIERGRVVLHGAAHEVLASQHLREAYLGEQGATANP